MNNEQALQLLKESILMTGTYNPSERFNNSKSVALELNDKPIIILGWEDDQESNDIATRLISSHHFLQLITHEYGLIESLKKTIVTNREVCPDSSYNCIIKSEQGLIEDGQGAGELVAVILDDNNALGFGICVNNDIMKCFYPNAKSLSSQVELNAS